MPAHRLRNPNALPRFPWTGLGAVLLLVLVAAPAAGLVRFDFEQKYYVHPGRQVWDFSIVRADSTYHIFYHAIPELTPGATRGDTIWHATSPDLKRWEPPAPVVTVGADSTWDGGATWAPDVYRDDSTGAWWMAYTGADGEMDQRIGFATSPDLDTWTKVAGNPLLAPDPAAYIWPDSGWSDFRDPFVYRDGGTWHVLATARKALDINRGVIAHATSVDLINWLDAGPLFVNDGATPTKVLESSQYHVIGSTHHLLFGEFDDQGITVLSAATPGDWTMADRDLLAYGYAPELDSFDPGVHLLSRLGNFYLPDGVNLGYVVRIDTLLTAADGSNPTLLLPHPMAEDWLVYSGAANLANPTFGDNPVWRGEPSAGLAGNGYYSSFEYHQGPLSGRGSPGTRLGNGATGIAESYRFPVTGDRMSLRVGGGHYPTTCYVALVDNADGTILRSATGNGLATMTAVNWDLTGLQGRTCYISIVDQEGGDLGYINVDEIVELVEPATVPGDVPDARMRHTAWPNPFNPRVTISFDLPRAGACEVLVWDLRGRLVWRSGERRGVPGTNSLVWTGRESAGGPAGAGAYLYGIAVDGTTRATGKITLVK